MCLRTRCESRCCGWQKRWKVDDGKRSFKDWETITPQNRLEGQTLPLCQMPQAEPEAHQDAGSLVLPELPPRSRRFGSMKILFLHGWHSVPGGVKPTYLKDHGHEVINPALDDDDFAAATATAQSEFNKHQPAVVVGSSRGGAIAMNINSGDAKLVLLCPAWKKYGTAKMVKPGTVILHSRADDVVPFADSEELAKNSGAKLVEVGSDHRLADPEPLAAMLKACEDYLL